MRAVLLGGVVVGVLWMLGVVGTAVLASATVASFYLKVLSVRRKVQPDDSGLPTVPPHANLPLWRILSLPFTDSSIVQIRRHRMHEVITRWAEEFGGIYRVFVGGSPTVVVSDPKIVGQMLSASHRDSLRDRAPEPNGISLVLPEGLLALPTSRKWAMHRRLIVGLFTQQKLSGYFRHVCAHCDTLAELWGREGPRTVDIHKWMVMLTLDVIGTSVLDLPFDALRDEESANMVIKPVEAGLKAAQVYVALMSLPRFLFSRLPVPSPGPLSDRVYDRMEKVLAGDVAVKDGESMMELLVEARDEDGEQLTKKEIHDEMLTFLGAGHETTANTLTFAFYLLAQTPEVQERVREEVRKVVGEDGTLDPEDVEGLEWVSAVVKETLRLYPTVPMWPRLAAKDVELGGCTVKEGTVVLVNNMAFGRDEKVFSNPTAFDPSRWIGNQDWDELSRKGFYPFGGGGRICIGRRFALMEANTILAYLLHRYRFTLPAETPRHPHLETQATITLHPAGPLRVVVAPV